MLSTTTPRSPPAVSAVRNVQLARHSSNRVVRCSCKRDTSSGKVADKHESPFVAPVEDALQKREQKREPTKPAVPSLFLTTMIASAAGGIMGLLPELSGPISTLQAIGILAGIVAFHELGHFTAARVQGIHVSKFAVGFGPSLWSAKLGEVEYSLRAFPLGGFVAFPDNDEDCPYPEDDPDLLKNRPILDRFWVISAGVIFNVILAFMVTVAQVQDIGYISTSYNPGVRLPVIMKGGAAERYGLLPGDVVLALDDKIVPTGPGAVSEVLQTIKNSRDISVDFTVARPAGVEHIQVLPDIASDGKGKIGVQLVGNVDIERRKAEGPMELLSRSAAEVGRLLVATADGLKALIGNFESAKENVSSPVAVVAVGSQVARESPAGLYSFAAVVNVNLAVVNVLPIPALDGGYLLLLAVELARQGKKLPQEVEATFMASGFLLLTGLGVFLILKDTIRFLQ